MLLPRFIPLIAFTALNWGAGLTPVPRGRFFWTTAVGIFPGALVLTASGAGLPFLLKCFPVTTWAIAGLITAYEGYRLYRRNTPRPGPEDRLHDRIGWLGAAPPYFPDGLLGRDQPDRAHIAGAR